MLICYFGYVCIAVSGVVASLISFSPIWYLPVPGANAIPAAPPRVQLLMPLVLEPETTELKTTLGCSSCSHFFWQAKSIYGKGLAGALSCSVAKYKGGEIFGTESDRSFLL